VSDGVCSQRSRCGISRTGAWFLVGELVYEPAGESADNMLR